jgi:hypothetical protein
LLFHLLILSYYNGPFLPTMYGQHPPNFGVPVWYARQNFNQIRSPSPAPLQQVVVENPVERRKIEEISFLKPHDPLPSGVSMLLPHDPLPSGVSMLLPHDPLPSGVSMLLPHDPLPIEALNSIRSIGTGEE